MSYYVYLLASKNHGTLYLGVTNDIVRSKRKIRGGLISLPVSQVDIGVMDSGLEPQLGNCRPEVRPGMTNDKKNPASLPGFCIVETA